MGIIQYNCKCKEETKTCPECKQESHDWKHYYNLREDYCFSCNLWTNHLNNLDPNIIRIKHHQYYIGKEEGDPRYRGFAGRKFLIKRKDDVCVINTTNLWHNGEIPEHFRERMPDNAVFVDDKQWIEISGQQVLANSLENHSLDPFNLKSKLVK